eukprot:7990359-Heterocapsa_arctica.AAC.1
MKGWVVVLVNSERMSTYAFFPGGRAIVEAVVGGGASGASCGQKHAKWRSLLSRRPSSTMSCSSVLPPIMVTATGGSISVRSTLKSTSSNHIVVRRCALLLGVILRMRRSSSHPMCSLWSCDAAAVVVAAE